MERNCLVSWAPCPTRRRCRVERGAEVVPTPTAFHDPERRQLIGKVAAARRLEKSGEFGSEVWDEIDDLHRTVTINVLHRLTNKSRLTK